MRLFCSAKPVLDWPSGKCSRLLFVLFSTKKLPGCPLCFPVRPAAWWSVTRAPASPEIPSLWCQGSCSHSFGWLHLGVGKVTPTSRVFFLVALFTISKSPAVENKLGTAYFRAAARISISAYNVQFRGWLSTFALKLKNRFLYLTLKRQNLLYCQFQFKKSLCCSIKLEPTTTWLRIWGNS